MKRLFLLIFLSVFIAVSSSYCDHEYGSGFNEGDFRIKDYKFIGTEDNDRIQFDTNADDTVDVTLTSSDITVDEVTYTGTDGAASGYVLITDGSGNTSFAGGGSISAPGSDNQIIYNNDGFFDSNASFLYDEDSNTMNIKSSGALYFGNDTNSYIYDSTYLRIVDTVGVYMTTPAVTFPDDATIGTYAGCKMGFDETADIISFQCDSVTMVSSGYNLAWTLDRANSPSMHFDPWNMTQGTFIDFSGWDGTNPKTLDGALVGIDMDLTTNLTLNNQDVTGLTITLPATYETGTEHAGYFSGDGRTVSICNDDYAIEADGDVNVSSGSDYHVNDVGLSDTKSGASGCSLVGAASVSGATYTTQCHRNDAFGSTGQQSGGLITHASGETINVSAGTGFIKAADSDVAELLSFDWVASNGIAIPTNSTRFIGVKWVDADNAPIVDSRVSQNWDLDTEFPLGSVINLGGILYILNNPWWVTDGITNLIEKSVGLGGYLARDKFVGGLSLGVTATRYPTMTSGTVWGRTNEFLMSAIDYSVVDVASHSAVFDVDNGSSQGTITASAGTPYTVLAEEQTIVITGTGDNDGAYTIHEITGGNVLTMEGVIAGTDGTEATTVIAPSFNTYWFELDGTVHETTGVTQYPVTQWNDIVNSRLTNLLPNKYANLWVFLNITNNELSLIYPTAYYSGSAKAEAESVPSTIPGDWYLEGMIIGKIVFKRSTDTPAAVLSVFETTFTASLAASHPNLTNLAWTDSGHTGTVSTFAGFDGAGAATNYTEANYILADGSRPLTANWDVGNFTLTANGLTLDGTFTDGTASIVGGAGSGFTTMSVGEYTDSSDSGTSTEWKAGYTHVSTDGSDHSYIDQTVISGSSPTFDGTNFTGIPDGALDTDYVEVAGDTMTGALLIDGTADVIQLKVQSHSTQNANPFEVEDSGASNLFTIDPGGNSYFAGNVGIGTTTPSAKLNVVGGTGVGASQAYIGDSSSGFWQFFNGGSPTSRVGLRAVNAASTETIRFDPSFGAITLADGGSIGQSAGPLITFDDTNNYLEITGCKVGIGTTSPRSILDLGQTYGTNPGDAAAKKLAIWQDATNFYGLGISNNTLEFHAQSTSTELPQMVLKVSGNVGIGTAVPATQTHIVEASTTAGLPVVTIDQSDVDEPFLKFIGTAASATLTNSIVDVGDVSTATVAGYIKVEVQDDGNQITDQDYYMEVLTLA